MLQFIVNRVISKTATPVHSDSAPNGSIDLSLFDQTVPESRGKHENGFRAFLKRIHERIMNMGHFSIRISKISPEMLRMISDIEQVAKKQLNRAGHIVEVSRRMDEDGRKIARQTARAARLFESISGSIENLEAQSRQISRLVENVENISLKTRILSVNAQVEAARAGEAGKGFDAVAKAIQELSEDVKEATRYATESLEHINREIGELIGLTGIHDKNGNETEAGTNRTNSESSFYSLVQQVAGASEDHERRINRVLKEAESICESARELPLSIEKLKRTSDRINHLSEGMLSEIGRFRLNAHKRASRLVEWMASRKEIVSGSRREMECFLQNCFKSQPVFELLYITDEKGMQITRNIGDEQFRAKYGDTGLGRNWSRRPWFVGVKRYDGAYISDIYRSAATDGFCFTVAVPVKSANGDDVKVLAADFHFDKLLENGTN
jgi:hypothetical protein